MAVLKYWDETLSQWLPVAPGPKGDKGDKGDTGDLANLDIGTVTTGSPAAAELDGNFEDGYTLDLTLPSVGAGSIHDADVNAAADIDRSKIAGTALTAETMGVCNVKDYGAVGDGVTDDTAAIEAALAAGAGGTVYFPDGVYAVAKSSRLTAIVAPYTALVGSSSAHASIKFTHASGGLDIGNGTDYVYTTTIQNISFLGMDVCEVPIRIRKGEELRFENVRVQNAAIACMDVSGTNLTNFDMLQMANSPLGMRLGQNATLFFTRNNYYLLEEAFRNNASTGVSLLVFETGWVELCRHFFTFDTAAGWGRILVQRSWFTGTLTDSTICRAVGGLVGCNGFEVRDTAINYNSTTAPLVDFTAVDNGADTFRVVLSNLVLRLAGYGSQVLIKPCPTQAQWWNFYAKVEDITGFTDTSKWYPANATAGGARLKSLRTSDYGAPEGVITSPPGSIYSDAGTGKLYLKNTGVGNTGWLKVIATTPAAANPDTSGASLGDLETEVNQLKALLRSIGLMES